MVLQTGKNGRGSHITFFYPRRPVMLGDVFRTADSAPGRATRRLIFQKELSNSDNSLNFDETLLFSFGNVHEPNRISNYTRIQTLTLITMSSSAQNVAQSITEFANSYTNTSIQEEEFKINETTVGNPMRIIPEVTSSPTIAVLRGSTPRKSVLSITLSNQSTETENPA
jgi:hypothetical protein